MQGLKLLLYVILNAVKNLPYNGDSSTLPRNDNINEFCVFYISCKDRKEIMPKKYRLPK